MSSDLFTNNDDQSLMDMVLNQLAANNSDILEGSFNSETQNPDMVAEPVYPEHHGDIQDHLDEVPEYLEPAEDNEIESNPNHLGPGPGQDNHLISDSDFNDLFSGFMTNSSSAHPEATIPRPEEVTSPLIKNGEIRVSKALLYTPDLPAGLLSPVDVDPAGGGVFTADLAALYAAVGNLDVNGVNAIVKSGVQVNFLNRQDIKFK